MAKLHDRKLLSLRLALAVNAIGWGISILGTFVPWSWLTGFLKAFGAGRIPPDPLLQYSLRMAAGAFFMLGVIYGLAAWKPKKYWNIIPFLGTLGIIEGIILFIHGTILQLSPGQFYGDIVFCCLPGIWTLLVYKAINSQMTQ